MNPISDDENPQIEGLDEAESMQLPSPTGIASLLPFPPMFQDAIIKVIVESRCHRATDIWYEDKNTHIVSVLRRDIQWRLNETASMLWLNLDKPIGEIIELMAKEFPEQDPREIQFFLMEFILNAYSYGLIEFLQAEEEK